LMEALLLQYNQLFLFDLAKLPATLNVTVMKNKADFQTALQGKTTTVQEDFVYLQYTDPAQSVLMCWDRDNMERPLAFQGFYQYLWSYMPRTPSWVELGLAYHFWNLNWNGTALSSATEDVFLDALLEQWSRTLPTDLSPLLMAESADPLTSWALVEFLNRSSDPVYSRIFNSILLSLAPAGTLENNRQTALQKFQSGKNLEVAAGDMVAWWKSRTSFTTLLSQGVERMKAKDYLGAQKLFSAALVQRAQDDQALYYMGLAAYELKDFVQAESLFSSIDPATLPPGLLDYARGMNAFAQKKWDVAKDHFSQAVTANETEYRKLVDDALALAR